MQVTAPTCLYLLASNGIIRVTFATSPNGDQSVALLKAAQAAKTVDELAQALHELGAAWGVQTQTKVVCRVRRAARVT